MELFRYRNLTLGSFFFLVTLFVSYYFNNTVRIATLVFTGVAFVFLILIPVVFRGKHGLPTLIRLTPTVIFVSLALILSLICFDKTDIKGYVDGEEHEMVATVQNTLYDSDHLCTYEIELAEIDGKEIDESVTITVYGAPFENKDIR